MVSTLGERGLKICVEIHVAAVSYFCSVDVSRDQIVSEADRTGLGTGFIR